MIVQKIIIRINENRKVLQIVLFSYLISENALQLSGLQRFEREEALPAAKKNQRMPVLNKGIRLSEQNSHIRKRQAPKLEKLFPYSKNNPVTKENENSAESTYMDVIFEYVCSGAGWRKR